jgi:hypothetical protein
MINYSHDQEKLKSPKLNSIELGANESNVTAPFSLVNYGGFLWRQGPCSQFFVFKIFLQETLTMHYLTSIPKCIPKWTIFCDDLERI